MGLVLTGCGTPGAPLAPSLKLPDPVTNLAATRTGDQVSLTWTMPKKTTDKLLVKGAVPARVCRKEGSGACEPVAGELNFAASAKGSLAETLPAALASGPPRVLTYFVELKNSKGRSAGLSNGAVVLAGAAPASLTGLSAEVRKSGVVLKWAPESAPAQSASIMEVVRLRRKLLTPGSGAKSAGKASAGPGLLAPPTEPVEQSLIVEPTTIGGAVSDVSAPSETLNTGLDTGLDTSIQFGNAYEYRAQRVARVAVGSQTLELAGPLSEPVRVEARDVFPPDIPSGLAAVATAADANTNPPTAPSIDLSWQPVTDSDVAGYVVYRREGAGNWERISPVEPVVGPGFHDVQVKAGHTYQYTVAAVDRGGRESARSPQAEETVPNP